jgi:YVTN family beta-propeller protein
MKSSMAVLSLVLFTAAASSPATASDSSSAQTYRITKSIALGTPDRWDYLTFDPTSGRLYISHGDRVTVVDGRSGEVLGQVEGLPGGTHGIAIVNALGRGYTDDGRAGVAVSFDLSNFRVVHRITAAPDADGIIFDPVSTHVFVIDGDSAKVTAIDPKTDQVIANIDTGGGMEFGTAGEDGKIYVNGAEKNEIVRIDTAANRADAHWPLTGCKSPAGLAMDHAAHRLFSSCRNKVLVVMDSDNGAVVATLPIGEGTDAAAFDPSRHLIFSSNREGTLSVILEQSPARYETLAPVPTEFGARTMALDPQSGRVFLVTADFALNPNAAESDPRRRYSIKPGSVRLLFLDPTVGPR